MKKLLIASLLAAPTFALAGMTSLEDGALSQVSGQDGVTITTSIKADIDTIRYTDTDAGGSSFNLNKVHFSSDGTATGAAVSTGAMNIDVLAGTAGKTLDSLQIVNGAMNFGVGVESMTVGTGATASGSLGGLKLSGVSMNGTSTKIWGHSGKIYMTEDGAVAGGLFGEYTGAAIAGKTIQGDGSTGLAIQNALKLNIAKVEYVDDTEANFATSTNSAKLENVTINKAGDTTSGVRMLNLIDVTPSGLQVVTAADKMDIGIQAIKFGTNVASVGKVEMLGLKMPSITTTIAAH